MFNKIKNIFSKLWEDYLSLFFIFFVAINFFFFSAAIGFVTFVKSAELMGVDVERCKTKKGEK